MKVFNILTLFGALVAAQDVTSVINDVFGPAESIASRLSSVISAGPSRITNFDELTSSLGAELRSQTNTESSESSGSETSSSSTIVTSTGTATSTIVSTSRTVVTNVSTFTTESGGSTITGVRTSVRTSETVVSTETKVPTTVTTTSPNAAPTKFVAVGAAAMAAGAWVIGAMV